MTFKSGDGWVTIQRGQMTSTAETALYCKALTVVAELAKRPQRPGKQKKVR